jgi:hypothetical protein
MNLRNYKSIGLLFFLLIGTQKSFGQNTNKPNIIFIMTDDQSSIVPLENEEGSSI